MKWDAFLLILLNNDFIETGPQQFQYRHDINIDIHIKINIDINIDINGNTILIILVVSMKGRRQLGCSSG